MGDAEAAVSVEGAKAERLEGLLIGGETLRPPRRPFLAGREEEPTSRYPLALVCC